MYVIKDWNAVFENYRSRERKDALRWVQIPTKQDAQAFRVLMSSAEGVMAYGIFVALVQIAAKMPVRGTLSDDKGPLTVKSMAVRIGAPEEIIQKALQVLASPEVAWISPVDHPGTTRRAPDDHPSITCQPPVDHPSTTEITFPSVPFPSSGYSESAGSRFVSDRRLRTGQIPDGFAAVLAAYPKHRRGPTIDSKALQVWDGLGLEKDARTVLEGIHASAKGKDWEDGAIPALDKFLSERAWERPAPQRRESKSLGGAW